MWESPWAVNWKARISQAKPARLAPERAVIGAWFVDWVLDGLTGHLGKPERDLIVVFNAWNILPGGKGIPQRRMLERLGKAVVR